MSPAIFLLEAAEEIEEAIHFYETRSPGRGKQFLKEVEVSVNEIEQDPEMWPS